MERWVTIKIKRILPEKNMVRDEKDECFEPVSSFEIFPAFLALIVKKTVFVM